MKPPQSHTPFLILAIAITVLVGMLYAYLYWQVDVSLDKAIAAREIALIEAGKKSREKDVLKLYEATASNRGRLAEYFIPSDGTVQFIEAVESIGPIAGSSVELTDIQADDLSGKASGTIGAVRAHVEARGLWVPVYKTLLFAERLPYKVTINNIRLSAGEGLAKTGQSWKIEFDIVGTLIVTPQQK
jgi:hypothetical protein